MGVPTNSPKFYIIVREGDHSKAHAGYYGYSAPKIYVKPGAVVKALNSGSSIKSLENYDFDKYEEGQRWFTKEYPNYLNGKTVDEYVAENLASMRQYVEDEIKAGKWIAKPVTLVVETDKSIG
jgi:hypothetical protein